MNLSHEFRTPLSLMHTSLQMAKRRLKKTNLNEETRNKFNIYMNTIKNNNYRLLKLVNNLLDLHKIDDAKYNMHFQNKDIVNTVKKIILSILEHSKAKHKSIKFNSELEKKIIRFDPFKIERVIINLIANALKFTVPGDEINVNIKETDNNILISVKDTGMGIPEDRQETIFNKFDHADSSLSRPNEGSGLGLTIVRQIIKLHDGEIDLDSKVGEGSKFTIKLPIKKIPEEKVNDYDKKSTSIIERMDIEFSDIYE